MEHKCLNFFKKVMVCLVTLMLSFSTTYAAETQSSKNEAFVDLNNLVVGEEYVLYGDKETGEKTSIELVESKGISTYATGNSGWSAGYCPSYATLKVNHSMLGYSASYYVVIENNVITRTYDLNISCPAYTVSYPSLSIVRNQASSSGAHARVTA